MECMLGPGIERPGAVTWCPGATVWAVPEPLAAEMMSRVPPSATVPASRVRPRRGVTRGDKRSDDVACSWRRRSPGERQSGVEQRWRRGAVGSGDDVHAEVKQCAAERGAGDGKQAAAEVGCGENGGGEQQQRLGDRVELGASVATAALEVPRPMNPSAAVNPLGSIATMGRQLARAPAPPSTRARARSRWPARRWDISPEV